jgi:3-oxoacyl-[acyl-carrier protein] reductase
LGFKRIQRKETLLRMMLNDRVVIVTGGANGIGRTYCERLFQEGARVVVADLDKARGDSLANELNNARLENRIVAVKTDVTSENEVDRLAQETFRTFGRIDVLINNAGTYPHVDFDKISYAQWQRVIAVNLDSVFLCCKAVLPHMKRQGSGKIINIATNLVWVGLAGMVHYTAAKSGIIGFTRSLAREVGSAGITVNAIAPGPVIPDGSLDEESLARLQAIVDYQCVKRRMRSEDLVGPILFLASSSSDFISAQVLSVDGGLTTH